MIESAKLAADWSILEIDGVQRAAERAARKTSKLLSTHEYDDLLQEAYILLATRPAEYHSAIEADPEGDRSLLAFRLGQDLFDRFKREAGRLGRTDSLDELMERRESDEG